MHIFSSGVPASEPAVPTAFTVSGVDAANVGEIVLTNSYAASGLQGTSVKIDGIRVGTTWGNTLLTNINFQFDLTAFIQGLYNSVSNKMITDTARVYLRYNFSPYSLVDSSSSVLDTVGNGNFLFNTIANLTPYFLVVKHRNSIETWSSSGQSFIDNNLSYDFTYSVGLAFGNNQIKVDNSPMRFGIYSGDVNQDGIVDGGDLAIIDNDALNFIAGYVNSDLNGDGIVDAGDSAISDNNSANFIGKVIP